MTTYDELRADLDTVTGLLHDLEARMAVRIEEHARMKEALKLIAKLDHARSGHLARITLESLKQEKS